MVLGLLLVEPPFSEQFSSILRLLRGHSQEIILESVLRNLEKIYLHNEIRTDLCDALPKNAAIGGIAALLKPLTDCHEILKIRLSEWVVTGLGGGIRSTGLRRAILAILRDDTGESGICRSLMGLIVR